MKNLLLIIFQGFVVTITMAGSCNFTGEGDGTSWSDINNWSCGSEPDLSKDQVDIPSGFNVVNNTGKNFQFENGATLTINGGLDMLGQKLEFIGEASHLTVSSGGKLIGGELFFNEDADGLIDDMAVVEIEHLKLDDETELVINASCILISEALENKGDSGIFGTGCIDFEGNAANFTNKGTGCIFGCCSNDLEDCTLNGGPLPVKFTSFESIVIDNKMVRLDWQTASETNNDYFAIERSRDGVSWEEIRIIKGAGNSTELLSYSALDNNPFDGRSYYIIKQVDFDGHFSYSDSKLVHIASTTSQVSVYSSQDQITIEGDTIALKNLKIYNIKGEDVHDLIQILKHEVDKVQIDLSNLNTGVYIVELEDSINKIYKR